MKFQIDKQQFLSALQPVAAVVPTKHFNPIQGAILLVLAQDGTLALEGRGQTMAVRNLTPVHVPQDGSPASEHFDTGEICAPAKRLLETVKSMPDGILVVCTTPKDRLSVKNCSVGFTMACEPAADFPGMGEPLTCTQSIPSATLLAGIAATAYATAPPNESHRYAIGAVQTKLEPGRLSMSATDTHRLAHWAGECDPNPVLTETMLIDTSVLRWVEKHMDWVPSPIGMVIGDGGKALWFRQRDLTLCARTQQGHFPNIAQVIPEGGTCVRVWREAAIAALRRVSSVSEADKGKPVTLTFSAGKLRFDAADSGRTSDAAETIPCSYEGEERTASFGTNYLIDALQAMRSDDAFIVLQESDEAPVKLMPVGDLATYICIVMPILGPEGN